MKDSLPRITLVDDMRGVAALAVAWFHMTNTYSDWVASTGQFGWLGVEAFFVISGFVIPYSIAAMYPNYSVRNYPEFISRRMVRLEPPYLASILLIVMITLLASLLPQFRGDADILQTGRVAAHLLYLIPFTVHDWFQPVYWTLAYEFFFYLIIGLLFPLVAMPRTRAFFILISLVICGAVIFSLFPARFLLFVMGVATFRFVLKYDNYQLYLSSIAIFGGCMLVAGAQLEALVGVSTATLIANFQMIPNYTPWLGWTLSRFGLISYSLYLVHVPVGGRIVNLGKRFIDDSVGHLMLSLLALIVSIFFAIVFWYFIEVPAQRFSRRIAFKYSIKKTIKNGCN